MSLLENEQEAAQHIKEMLLRLQEQQLGNYEAGAVDTLTGLLDMNLPPELRQRSFFLKQTIEQFDAEGALKLLNKVAELRGDAGAKTQESLLKNMQYKY